MWTKPEKCAGCPLYEAPGPVPPSVPGEFSYVVVGEAPGAHEVDEWKPFVGPSGRKLRVMLQRSGIRPSQCAFANAVWCRPPNNETPSKEAVEFCTKRWLDPWLAEHAAGKRLLIVGSVASEHLLGEKITACAGYVYKGVSGSEFAVPVLHPAAILRNPAQEPFAQRCISKLATVRTLPSYDGYIKMFPRYGELEAFVQRAIAGTEVCFDFETKSFEDLTPISVAVTSHSGETVVTSWDPKVASILRPLWEAPELIKVAYNIKFDAKVIHQAYGRPPAGAWHDPMRMAQLADLDVSGLSLEAVAPAVLNISSWKRKVSSEGLFTYNAKDSLYTWLIYKTLLARRERTSEFALWRRTADLERVVYDMEMAGLAVDLERMIEVRQSVERELDQLKARWKELAGNCNPLSPTQVQALLKRLGFKFWKTNEGKENTEELYLKLAANQQPQFRELIGVLLDIRKASKLLSTYLDYAPDADGRVHPNINVCGTVSGRPSFSHPNLGNVPKDDPWGIRSFFIAGPGMVFVSSDWSQAEAAITAKLGCEDDLVLAISKGLDVHKLVASRLYGVPESLVSKEQRQLAKRILYGISYGAGARKVSEHAGVSFAEASLMVKRFAAEFPRYWGILEEWNRRADEEGVLRNPFGRVKSFYGPRTATQSRNWIPQSTVADMMNITLCELAPLLAPLGARIVLQVYDQILVETPLSQAEKVAKLVHGMMTRPWPELGGFSLRADTKVGKRWSEV